MGVETHLSQRSNSRARGDRSQSPTAGGCRSQSRHPQALKRSAGRSSIDVGHNDQFKYGDPGEFDPIIFDLADCAKGTEIPLLADNFSKRAPAVQRPSQDELLGAPRLGFFEDERNALCCVVLGTGKMLDDFRLLRKLSIESMAA